MRNRFVIRLYMFACVVAACACWAAPAAAQFQPLPNPATGERYRIEASAAWWFPDATMLVASEGLGQLGTAIDFKKDLGLDDQRMSSLRVVLRPTRRAKFRFELTPMKYESSGTVTRDLVFNGQRYRASLPVNSTLDWKAYRFAFEYDVVVRDRGFAGFLLEAKYSDIQTELRNPVLVEFARARAPIPAVGGIGRVYVARNISVTGELTGFKLPENLIEGASGHFVELDLYGTLNVTKNVGVQVGYRSLDIGVTVNADTPNTCPALAGSGTSACLTMRGAYLGVVARY